MKASVSLGMAAHLAQDVTTLAHLWKVIRQDGVVYGFTDHDEPITYAGLTYQPSTGFIPSAVATANGLAVDDLSLEGVLSSSAITAEDLLAGLWDGAQVWLYRVNYKDSGQGAIILRRGWTGEVKGGQVGFVAELRGVTQRLAQQIGQNYSPSCRASFCDARCTLTLDDYKVSGTITGVTDRRIFTDSARLEAAGTFNFGLIAFTSGENTGLSVEVKSFQSSTIECELALPFDVAVGDTYDLWQGCDKRFSTCRDTYNNVVNFRGEPYIPISDALVSGPK